MFGVIMVTYNNKSVVIQPLFEEAEPQKAGVKILQFLHMFTPESIKDAMEKVSVIPDLETGKKLAATGKMDTSYLNYGADVLFGIITHSVPKVLDARSIADEDPKNCVVYEINLDGGLFSTYLNATMPYMSVPGWRIMKKTGPMREVFKNLQADSAAFRLDKLPCAEKYMSYWMSQKKCEEKRVRENKSSSHGDSAAVGYTERHVIRPSSTIRLIRI